jgi:hypothetical protein
MVEQILHRTGLGGRPPSAQHEPSKPEDATGEIRKILSVLMVPFFNHACTEEEWRQRVNETFAEKVPKWRESFGAKALTEALKSLDLERFDT